MPQAELALVMPMAGRGSRFSRAGVSTPKPLVQVAGRPFFWWAAESVVRRAPVREMVFVVLEEHCATHGIDEKIRGFYPQARIVRIGDVTGGAAETAGIAMRNVRSTGPVAVNDCDHAFECARLGSIAERLAAGQQQGALLCFRSQDPAYSYAVLDPRTGAVVGTAEKEPLSPHAIAGCYLFSSATAFLHTLAAYRQRCPYEELFVSGMYDVLASGGARVGIEQLQRHWVFGTPEEYRRLPAGELERAFGVTR